MDACQENCHRTVILMGQHAEVETYLTHTFTKRETFGYSLNGGEFLIPGGQSYAGIHNTFEGIHTRILSGQNGSIAADGSGRPLTKTVNFGWSRDSDAETASQILSIWGMANDLGSGRTDMYTLAMTYNHFWWGHFHNFDRGRFVLATRDERGNWVNAVERNYGGTTQFIFGPWQPGYALGTYGLDPHTRTVWAVLNHDGDFAAQDLKTVRW